MFKMISASAAAVAVAAFGSQAIAGECQSSKYKQTATQAGSHTAQERTAYRPVQTDIVDTAVGAENFKTLVAAVKAAGLVDALKSTADLRASNGIIHVIDTVLLPPADIVDTAVGADDFKTLVVAVKAAGLVEALKGKGPFTVFAPTDEAFAKLPEGTIPALLKDNDKLAAVLTYHVVPGYVTAADAMKLNRAKTLQGGELKISSDGGVHINGAKVIKADILTANGVIHVIDSVLLPN
jgi:uncharacterized surface protein with fasciclin (FAS1) repeats